MTSLRINFNHAGATLDLTKKVTGAEAIWQRCGVNIGTVRGSDKVFTAKGTHIFAGALTAAVSNPNSLRHACNFAAIDTLEFIQTTALPDAAVALVGVTVEVTSVRSAKIALQMTVKTSDGSAQSALTII